MDPIFAIPVSLALAWLLVGFYTVASLYGTYFGVLPLAAYLHGAKISKQEREVRHFLIWHPFVVFFSTLLIGPTAIWFMTGTIRDQARERLRKKWNRQHASKAR